MTTPPRTAELIQGPYWSRRSPLRADIREGRDGLRLTLELRLVDANAAFALAGLAVDIWHADATGRYSGYAMDPDAQPQDVRFREPADDATFLRGTEVTGTDGRARFVTVFPGWYACRTPHVHVKVFDGDRCVLTTQLFLAEADSERVYQHVPAYARGVDRDTHNGTDIVIARAASDVDGCWITIEDDAAGGLRGVAVLSLDPVATSRPVDAPAGFKPPLGGLRHDKTVR